MIVIRISVKRRRDHRDRIRVIFDCDCNQNFEAKEGDHRDRIWVISNCYCNLNVEEKETGPQRQNLGDFLL